jgi:hypothetical protein
MSRKAWFIGSDMIIGAVAVKDAKTDEYDNEATITFTLFNSATKQEIPDAVDLPMEYEADSNGEYYGTLPSAVTATLVKGENYFILITITGINFTLVLREERKADYYP